MIKGVCDHCKGMCQRGIQVECQHPDISIPELGQDTGRVESSAFSDNLLKRKFYHVGGNNNKQTKLIVTSLFYQNRAVTKNK